MALSFNDKKIVVSNVHEAAKKASSALVCNYSGSNVEVMTNLRVEGLKKGVYIRVVRNTLAKIALKNTDFECLSDDLTGQSCVVFAYDEPGSAAKLLKELSKEHKSLKVSALSIGGKRVSADNIDQIASLPTYEEALGILVSVLSTPGQKLCSTLSSPSKTLVGVLGELQKQKS